MLSDLSAQTIGLVVLGGFLGGMASGAAGFAYGVVATSIWLHAISPIHAALLVVSGGLINQTGLVWTMRRTLEFGRLWPFLIVHSRPNSRVRRMVDRKSTRLNSSHA